MRVALLSHNARAHDAIGNHVAETAAFLLERGSSVRVFVECVQRLHPALRACTQPVDDVVPHGPVWEYLGGADIVVAQYSQSCKLLQFLPLLAGGKPRLLLDYHAVTPPALWGSANREALERGMQERGLVWCVDEAIAHSSFSRQELSAATGFPAERIHRMPLVVDRARFRADADGFLQRRLGIAGARPMLYVGRVAPNKRVPILVEALTHLPADVHAAIVGDMSDIYAVEADRCRARAHELGVADRVHFLGQLSDDELAKAYRSAAALAMPSLHEGFCVPVIEAMASGLPVIAARTAALPETVGDAGLTFVPDDAADLARQVLRVLGARSASAGERPPSLALRAHKRVAIACFRFGDQIVGGAETSLRTIAHALQSAGHHVEVFTTCTKSESNWRNELPAGTTNSAGLTIHRFPIDPHDREAHLEAVRVIVEASGPITPEQEAAYQQHSIHSTALLHALEQRSAEFDAIITGPYLFGLTCDVAHAFPERTLLLPCFHEEPIARVAMWPAIYGGVGGILLHSPEEKELTLARLGINNPNAVEIGTLLEPCRSLPRPATQRPHVVYCGRYSREKNVPLLLDWMRRYREERPGRCDLVLLGQGEVPIPREPWLHDLGWVDEEGKREVLAGAKALVQLSRQESLSLVALEAWAQETPVIVHRDCAVLAGQVARSQGGIAVGKFADFAHALDDLADVPAAWRERGRRGRAYVETHYASRESFVNRIVQAVDALDVTLRDRMRRRGLERSACCDRLAWRESFGRVVENLLDAGPRPVRQAIIVEPLRDLINASCGARTVLVPVRVHNRGTHAVVADGPARVMLWAKVCDPETNRIMCEKSLTPMPGIMVPGATQTAMLHVLVPLAAGVYEMSLGADYPNGGCNGTSEVATARLRVEATNADRSALAPLLDGVRDLLVEARAAQRLPDDYVDVTEGWLARGKRWVKKKLLNNFKRGYVDVLSRQQSQLNRQLVAAVEQLADCCATLDHALRVQQARIDARGQEPGCAEQPDCSTLQGRSES